MGIGAISPTTIREWMLLTGNRLEQWEIRAILKMDQVYRRVVLEAQKTGS